MDTITLIILIFTLIEAQIAFIFALYVFLTRARPTQQVLMDDEEPTDARSPKTNTHEDYIRLFKEITQ